MNLSDFVDMGDDKEGKTRAKDRVLNMNDSDDGIEMSR